MIAYLVIPAVFAAVAVLLLAWRIKPAHDYAETLAEDYLNGLDS